MKSNDNMFKDIENKTGVNMNQIMQIVNSMQNADLTDEATARRLIRQVSSITNKPISKEKEDRLVKSIVNKDVPNNLSFISQMLKK